MNEPAIKPDAEAEIPQKLYFRIGEASKLVGVPPYVLRYWETEFPGLAPKKSGAGHRFYRRKDVELLLQIKQLLYDKRFTIEGARRHLELQAKPPARPKQRPVKTSQQDLFAPATAELKTIRDELASILDLLKR